MTRYSKHPVKALYLTYQVSISILLLLPFWIITSILPPLRPRRTWSFGRSFRIRAIRHFLTVSTRVGGILGGLVGKPKSDHLAIAPGLEIDAEWVEPDPSLVLGKLAEYAAISEVEPIRIPAYWLRQPTSGPKILPGEKVVIAFHGGAYVSMSASPKDPTAAIARGLLEHTPSIRHVFSPEYRLCSYKHGNPFPSALLDALAAYVHLVRNHGVSPQDVIVEGDSAGGNLAHALVRYLVEYRSELEPHGLAPPGALLLLSPWCDLGTSHDLPDGPSYFEHSDYLHLGGADARVKPAQRLFTGPHGLSAADTNVYISPSSLHLSEKPSFEGFPSTFIVLGGAEALAPQIRVLSQRMQNDLGEKVITYEAVDAFHDYIAMEWVEPERTETLKAIAAWVNAL